MSDHVDGTSPRVDGRQTRGETAAARERGPRVVGTTVAVGGHMGNSTKTVADASAGDEAMSRYADGDDAAFAVVYAVVAPRLDCFFSRRLFDKNAIPDLVQETLLRIHRSRGTFARGSSLMPWALTIARRLLIDLLRRSGREQQSDPAWLDDLGDRPSPQGLPTGEEIVAAKQMAARLDDAWARVSEPQRAALRLVRGEGLSVAEAAVRLGTTVMGVKLRTHRASRALQAGIAADLAA
jgi:RNA polymerase sigma-70 factor (ECF subfamily)